MATIALTTTLTVLDLGTSSTDLLVVNSGSSSVYLVPGGQRLRPGQSLHVQPGGQPVSAYVAGLATSGQVDVSVLAIAPAAPTGGAVATTSLEAVVVHDGTAGGGTRPTGYSRVRWVSPPGTSYTRPTNMGAGDVWEHDA